MVRNYGEASARQMNWENKQSQRKRERIERELRDYVPNEDN